jgi:uroporphyrin-III C-methyltransferase/precorrin-2 dehydrogenase/sirohydrochlorin ferrochelatase
MPLFEAYRGFCSSTSIVWSESFQRWRWKLPNMKYHSMSERAAMTRAPQQIETARIAPLSRLPAFFALNGKRAVVVGGSAAATWKAELLSAAGAQVDVFAPEPGEDMLALASAPPNGAVVIARRNWSADDFSSAAIAVADCPNDEAAAQFAARSSIALHS